MSETIQTTMTSADPSGDGSLSGAMDFVFKKMIQSLDGQLPAEIISYDRENNRATVKPLINILMTNSQQLERPLLASIPVLALGGGGFNVTFPLKPGDKGWIEASDRDISLFLQSGNQTAPNTLRLWDFADGRFIPDVFSDYTLPSDHEGKLIIQSKSGDVVLSLSKDEILIEAQKLTVNADSVKIKGNVEISGSLKVNQVDFSTHIHPGVSSGKDVTGGPK